MPLEVEQTRSLQVPHDWCCQEAYEIVRNIYDPVSDEFPQSQIVEVQRHVLHEGTRFLTLGGYGISESGDARSVRVLEKEVPNVWEVEQQNMIKDSRLMKFGRFMDGILDRVLGKDLHQMPHYSPLPPHENPGRLLLWADGSQKIHLFLNHQGLKEICEKVALETPTISTNRQWHVHYAYQVSR